MVSLFSQISLQPLTLLQAMKSGLFLSLLAATLTGSGIVHAVEFEADILPIFTNRCGKCHMEGKSKGSLSLELDKISREIGPSKSIVPGDSAKSELVKLMCLPEDDEDRMPPEKAAMPESEIGKIKTWIDEGAMLPGDKPKEEEKKAEEEKKPEEMAAPETWTSTTGTSVTATLIKVDAVRKSILLKMDDGKTIEVAIAKLDEDSKARARKYWEAHK